MTAAIAADATVIGTEKTSRARTFLVASDPPVLDADRTRFTSVSSRLEVLPSSAVLEAGLVVPAE